MRLAVSGSVMIVAGLELSRIDFVSLARGATLHAWVPE